MLNGGRRTSLFCTQAACLYCLPNLRTYNKIQVPCTLTRADRKIFSHYSAFFCHPTARLHDSGSCPYLCYILRALLLGESKISLNTFQYKRLEPLA